MINIDSTYTLKYVYAGINQYADFDFSNGKLIRNSFRPSYAKVSDIPTIFSDDINDIIKIIKRFTKNVVVIHKINGYIPKYHKECDELKTAIVKFDEQFKLVFNPIIEKYYVENILPVLKKNKWKHFNSWCGVSVLVKNDENIDTQTDDYKYVDFLCQQFLSEVLHINVNIEDKSTVGHYHSDCFEQFMKYIPTEMLIKHKMIYVPSV
jgi:hypothetical protein